MGDLEVYGNYECNIIKINISEEEVLEKVEKTEFMKLKESQGCSEKAELQNRPTGKSMQHNCKKQGCFPRQENFPVPK